MVIEDVSAIKGKDIVVVSIQPWYYELGSNCKNIALQLAKDNRVLYIDSPVTRKTFLLGSPSKGVQEHCKIIKTKKGSIKEIQENLWEYSPTSLMESINWIPWTWLYKKFNYINSKRFANNIQDAIKELGFKDIIVFNDNNFFNAYNLKELLKPSLFIYYCRDFLQGYDYFKPHAKVMEPELIKKSDLIVANSTYYTEYCSQFNRNSHYIGQGCNVELFDHSITRKKPKDMTFPSPVIGYVGALDSARLDISIIELIARSNPEWSVVLVGPEDAVFEKSILHTIPNVHFLGRKNLAELPDYVAAFDVTINPQLINEITHGNYPLKIDEYLSMGKPVVATQTAAMKLFAPYTFLATRPEEYPDLIRKAIISDTPETRLRRIAFGTSHTWKNSVEALYREINRTYETRNDPGKSE